MSHRIIIKIGLVVTESNRMLLVRKRGGTSFILPGGKPEKGESDSQALAREIDEELGCSLEPESVTYLGEFSDVAADLENTTVTIRLYSARLVGTPAPASEIESLAWFRPDRDVGVALAPSLQNKIVPFLYAEGKLVPAV